MLLQATVDQNDNQARTKVHQEGGEPNRDNSPHHLGLQPIDALLEMEQTLRLRKMHHLKRQRDGLRDNRRPCRSLDAPAPSEDEDRVEHAVDHHGEQGRVHRHPRESRRAQHGIQTQIHVRDYIAIENDPHIIFGIGNRLLTTTEEDQHRIEKKQKDRHEEHTQDHVQHKHVAQHMVCPHIILLAQLHRHQRRGTHTH